MLITHVENIKKYSLLYALYVVLALLIAEIVLFRAMHHQFPIKNQPLHCVSPATCQRSI